MLRDVLTQITTWQIATFPASTPESCLRHLRKELWEIRHDLRDGDLPSLALEFGDVVFLAVQGAVRCGYAGDAHALKLPEDYGRHIQLGTVPDVPPLEGCEEMFHRIRYYAKRVRQEYALQNKPVWDRPPLSGVSDYFCLAAESALEGMVHCGFDPEAILRMKLLQNKQREWDEPDEYGVVEHIR